VVIFSSIAVKNLLLIIPDDILLVPCEKFPDVLVIIGFRHETTFTDGCGRGRRHLASEVQDTELLHKQQHDYQPTANR
jgi:hypothetical protein